MGRLAVGELKNLRIYNQPEFPIGINDVASLSCSRYSPPCSGECQREKRPPLRGRRRKRSAESGARTTAYQEPKKSAITAFASGAPMMSRQKGSLPAPTVTVKVRNGHESSNASAVDAMKQALAVYPAHDAQRERFEGLERRLRELVKEFDGVVDASVISMSRRPPKELVFHAGDSLFVFLKGTGSIAPKLRMTLRIRRLAVDAGKSAPVEAPFGVLTRAFDDPPEVNRQQNILFAQDYQRYWVSLFTLPLFVANPSSANGVSPGVVQNLAIVGKLPGDYIATIELFDETTQHSTTADIEFSVVPN